MVEPNRVSPNDINFANTLAFMGVPNKRVDYVKVANDMGIEPKRANKEGVKIMQIITPENSSRDMRRAVEEWSGDASRIAQRGDSR